MQLNLDCIRDILFEVEAHSSYGNFYAYNPENLPCDSFLSKYNCDTVMYHIRQCSLSGYLFNVNWELFNYVGIEDLTPEGHAFLSNIRTIERWSKTKSIISKVGGAALKLVSATAEGITTALINQYMQEVVPKK